jgi:hypothetical protein
MKHGFILLSLLFLSSDLINAQIIKGRITNESGEAIQYATVYIQELRQGTTANIKGDYEIKLAPGKYQVTYQSLGYGPVIYNVTLTDQPVTKNIVLPLQYYMIPEVRITATGEDPAYGIMRKAIGMAPYYLNNISYYKADVYLKGNVVVNKIPKLLQKAMKAEAKKDEAEGGTGIIMKEGDVYLMESFNEVEFTAPDKYVQKVISVNSTFPESQDNVSPMDFINASFYQPMIADMAISPLSPQAFSYYKFQYLGATPQGPYTINKIRVVPKMKSQQLFDGIIYIIEDLWCIQSLDLTNDNIMGKISVKQLYIPVKDDIWMPVSHNFLINVGILGVRVDVSYGGSVKYLDVKPNTSLKKPESVTSDFYRMQAQTPGELPVSKSQQKIEEILQKDDLNNRDMVKLSKLMDQESKKAQPDSVRKNLEIKDNTSLTVEKDANKKDSTYWSEIRPVPLSDIETKSIRLRDSIKTETSLRKSQTGNDSIPKSEKKKRSKFGQALHDISFGHTWSDTTGHSFYFGGLLDRNNISFNTVDGFKYGVNFRISKTWKNKNSLTIAPDFRWAFSRESLLWRVNGGYNFNRMKQMSLSLNTGMVSRDISNGGSINPLLNSITSLFMERNYLKLYETRFLFAGFRTEITNGLNVSLSASYEDRRVLENTTDYSFINTSRDYTSNVPVNSYLDSTSNPYNAIRDQRHFEFSANLVYTPRMKYSVRGGYKVNRGSDWPTFSLTWEHGINEFADLADSYKHYDMIRLDISRSHSVGAFTEFNWRVRTGGFLNNTYVPYYDFFHFNAQPLLVLIDDYHDSFKLPAYYSLSTPEFFGEAHLKYTTPYLLLKYLPGLSKTLMRENLSLSYLGSRYHRNYTEIGYSITELLLLGELGVYVGFEDLKYKSIGARLVIRLN